MKRLIALLLCVIMLTSSVAPSVFAVDSEEEAKEDILGTLSYTCTHDVANDQVIISGTVDHDIMTGHGDHTISVYAIPSHSTYEDVVNDPEIKPLASSAMALKFTFHVNIKTIADRYSRYAVVIVSPSGEKTLAAQPVIPSVESSFKFNMGDRSAYKGILIDSAAKAGDSGAGTVVVDINVEKVLGDSSDSILCPMNDTYIYINKSYLTEIDKKVVTASAAGSRVYLRYLLTAFNSRLSYAVSEDSGRYGIPNLYDEEIMSKISAISTFIADRYDGGKGRVSGFVLGTQTDDTEVTNYIGDMSEEKYTEMYALYLATVGNAVRAVDPLLDVVIPLSDKNSYSQSGTQSFLERVVSVLDSMLSDDFLCSVMIESDASPLGITNNSLSSVIDTSAKGDGKKLTAENISVFVAYMERLLRRYDSAPANVIYMWNVPSQLTGTALCCAYSYIYYKLHTVTRVSAFVAAFNSSAHACYDSLDSIFKYINTDSGTKYTEHLAQYFGHTSWASIIGSSVSHKPTSSVIQTQMTSDRPKNIVGEFVYVDFSSPSALNFMSAGQKCVSIRSDYNALGERAICINSAAVAMGEAVECIGLFSYPESYKYTPQMSMVICVEGNGKTPVPLYEVSLTLGDGSDRIIANGVVKDGEKTELVFDCSSYGAAYLASYMKVSVRCLTSDAEGFTVRLHELKGYSSQHNSNDLAMLVDEHRQQIKNSGSDDKKLGYKFIVTIVGIAFSVVAVGIGLMMVFKKEEADEDSREEGKEIGNHHDLLE